MATAQDIVDAALAENELTNPTQDQRTTGFDTFNQMLAQWGTNRLMFPSSSEDIYTLTEGTASYSIGEGGDIDTKRIIEIHSAYVRRTDYFDGPVDVDMSQKDYFGKSDKTTRGIPQEIYHQRTYPLSNIFLYPAPDFAYELHLFSRKHVAPIATLRTEIPLPLEYDEAMIYGLAVRLAAKLDTRLKDSTVGIASRSMKNIEEINTPSTPNAQFESALTRRMRR